MNSPAATKPSLTIRPMRRTDIDSVMKIELRAYPSPWTAQLYINEITNPAALYLVALTGTRLVGYGGLWVVMDEAHLTTIAVDPDCRGRKFGERILMEMLTSAIQRGARRATLEVREGNDAARALYEKYGFTWIAIRRNYYPDNNENAIVMWINDMHDADWRRRYMDNRVNLGLL